MSEKEKKMKLKEIPCSDKKWDEIVTARYAACEKPDMSEKERLGLALCRLNSWLWDDVVGECPKDFYSLPHYSTDGKSRSDYITGPLREIKAKLGEEDSSKYWWLYGLGITESKWREWYFAERLEEERRSQTLWNVARGLWLILLVSTLCLWIMRLIR